MVELKYASDVHISLADETVKNEFVVITIRLFDNNGVNDLVQICNPSVDSGVVLSYGIILFVLVGINVP